MPRVLRLSLFLLLAVAACSGTVTGSESPAWSTRGKPDRIAPTVPAPVTAAAASRSEIDLSRPAATDSGGFGLRGNLVYRDGSLLREVLAPTTATADTGRAASSSHTYAVAAVDHAGNASARSPSVTATTPACRAGLPARWQTQDNPIFQHRPAGTTRRQS